MEKNIAKIAIITIVLLLGQKTFSINLKFYKKPTDISYYQWSVKRIRKKVEKIMKQILDRLQIDTGYWNNKVETYKKTYDQEVAEEVKDINKKPISKKIKDAICYIANHPNMRAILGITGIREFHNHIRIYIKNKPFIKIICSEKIDTSTFGRTIILNAIESELTSTDILISNITHELGHIHYQHCYFREIIENIYDKFGKKVRYRKSEFVKDYEKLMKRQEFETDILSIFNDVREGKKAALSFKNSNILDIYTQTKHLLITNMKEEEEKEEDDDDDEYDSHPSNEERFALLKYITDEMEQVEINQNKISTQKIIELARLAIETEEYFKASHYLSCITQTLEPIIPYIQILKTYTNAHICLLHKNYTNAKKLFSLLAKQDTNLAIKAKSVFMLGIFELHSFYNRNNGIALMRTSLQQNNCIRTKIKAHRILEIISKEKVEPAYQNPVTLCQRLDLQKIIAF